MRMSGADGAVSGEGAAGCGSWMVPSFAAVCTGPDPVARQGARMRSEASRYAVFMQGVPFPAMSPSAAESYQKSVISVRRKYEAAPCMIILLSYKVPPFSHPKVGLKIILPTDCLSVAFRE